MRKRPSQDVKINHERWLVSYADFVTLLFAFFVVMYSVSQVNESKYKMLSETLEKTFNVSSASNVNNAKNNTTDNDFNGAIEQQSELADLKQVANELSAVLANMMDTGEVSLAGNEQWIEVSLNAELLFSSGQAKLQSKAGGTFRLVADILSPYANGVEVSGHTDNIPIRNAQFSNNWELSSARAVSVVNLLSAQGISPERLSAVGYGEYRPIADNSSQAGRQQNRRVVLRVNNLASQTDTLPRQSTQARSSAVQTISQPTEDDPVKQVTEKIGTTIEPVELDGGGLLFTSDPDLERP